jgi:hypothetical protein
MNDKTLTFTELQPDEVYSINKQIDEGKREDNVLKSVYDNENDNEKIEDMQEVYLPTYKVYDMRTNRYITTRTPDADSIAFAQKLDDEIEATANMFAMKPIRLLTKEEAREIDELFFKKVYYDVKGGFDSAMENITGGALLGFSHYLEPIWQKFKASLDYMKTHDDDEIDTNEFANTIKERAAENLKKIDKAYSIITKRFDAHILEKYGDRMDSKLFTFGGVLNNVMLFPTLKSTLLSGGLMWLSENNSEFQKAYDAQKNNKDFYNVKEGDTLSQRDLTRLVIGGSTLFSTTVLENAGEYMPFKDVFENHVGRMIWNAAKGEFAEEFIQGGATALTQKYLGYGENKDLDITEREQLTTLLSDLFEQGVWGAVGGLIGGGVNSMNLKYIGQGFKAEMEKRFGDTLTSEQINDFTNKYLTAVADGAAMKFDEFIAKEFESISRTGFDNYRYNAQKEQARIERENGTPGNYIVQMTARQEAEYRQELNNLKSKLKTHGYDDSFIDGMDVMYGNIANEMGVTPLEALQKRKIELDFDEADVAVGEGEVYEQPSYRNEKSLKGFIGFVKDNIKDKTAEIKNRSLQNNKNKNGTSYTTHMTADGIYRISSENVEHILKGHPDMTEQDFENALGGINKNDIKDIYMTSNRTTMRIQVNDIQYCVVLDNSNNNIVTMFKGTEKGISNWMNQRKENALKDGKLTNETDTIDYFFMLLQNNSAQLE